MEDLHLPYSSFATGNDVVPGQDLSFEFGVELVVAVWGGFEFVKEL